MTKHLSRFGMVMSAIALAFALAVSTVAPASAQELDPEQLALARKYVELTDQSKIYEVTLLQAGVKTMKTIMAQNPEIKDQATEAIGKTINDYAEQKGDLLDQFARVYALRFTTDELKQIVAFYESDVGKKLSAANPEINQQLQQVMRVFRTNLSTEFFAKVRAKLKDEGIDL